LGRKDEIEPAIQHQNRSQEMRCEVQLVHLGKGLLEIKTQIEKISVSTRRFGMMDVGVVHIQQKIQKPVIILSTSSDNPRPNLDTVDTQNDSEGELLNVGPHPTKPIGKIS
jgi:hypothetical protein